MVLGLPFSEVWAIDFEYVAPDGERPRPICLVARELGSNRLLRLFEHELPETPPFRTDAGVLFVTYSAHAEWQCFLQLNWALPERIIDPYFEHSAAVNGLGGRRSLLDALSFHGIPAITSAEKAAGRALVMSGGPWTPEQEQAILDYCQTDVDPLGALLERQLVHLRRSPLGLGRALLRGRYSASLARMSRVGVPIDVPMLERLRAGWDAIKAELVRQIDGDYGVFVDTTFKAGLFRQYLRRHRIGWPTLPSGELDLKRQTFKAMAAIHPQLEPLRELRHALSEMRLEELVVGADGRNRVYLNPFGAKTGRNAPSNTGFVFGPATWLRSLIRPEPGRALAYIDWSSQEVAIAAALSGDQQLLEELRRGDPYIGFAVLAGLAPAGATKQTHPEIRDACKTVMLGSFYGMGVELMSVRTGLSRIEASELLFKLGRTFPTLWAWRQSNADRGALAGRVETVFGWPMRTTSTTRSTTLINFPVQANGAEMMRIACCLATEAGVDVCCPIHDALLIEAAAGELDDAISTTQAAMAAASRAVLGDLEVGTDVKIVRWPDRYSDQRGVVMWNRVTELLTRLAA